MLGLVVPFSPVFFSLPGNNLLVWNLLRIGSFFCGLFPFLFLIFVRVLFSSVFFYTPFSLTLLYAHSLDFVLRQSVWFLVCVHLCLVFIFYLSLASSFASCPFTGFVYVYFRKFTFLPPFFCLFLCSRLCLFTLCQSLVRFDSRSPSHATSLRLWQLAPNKATQNEPVSLSTK